MNFKMDKNCEKCLKGLKVNSIDCLHTLNNSYCPLLKKETNKGKLNATPNSC